MTVLFPRALFPGATEKNEPACTLAYGDASLKVYILQMIHAQLELSFLEPLLNRPSKPAEPQERFQPRTSSVAAKKAALQLVNSG